MYRLDRTRCRCDPGSCHDWKYGVSVGAVSEAPLPRSDKILQWDDKLGMRVRK
jgi:hypothetical protein